MSVEQRMDEAIAWHLRLSNPAASAHDWAEFTNWLDADPVNADCYDSVAVFDADLTDTLQITKSDTALPQNDNEPALAGNKWYQRRGFLAVAASAALAVLISPALMSSRDLQGYETKLGETREIGLSDGSQIAMNGGTRLTLDRKTNRFARIDAGEAVFTIRHDAANPFVVETADSTLRDLGTVFNVRQDMYGLEVAVAKGSVQYNPRSDAITVTAGNRLTISRDRPIPVISKTDPTSVGGWRQGRLTYQATPLSVIALDLTRTLGTPVSVSKDVAGRRFTGVIRIDQDRTILFHRLESLLSIRAKHTANGWQLTS
jgi:transmembrane sensor